MDLSNLPAAEPAHKFNDRRGRRKGTIHVAVSTKRPSDEETTKKWHGSAPEPLEREQYDWRGKPAF